MSRRRRQRTSRQFSPPSSTIAAEVVKTEPLKLVEAHDPYIHYPIGTDEEICAIHRFLMVVAEPVLQCPINVVKSLDEIIRVVKFEAAIMVMHGETMVGTMGIIRPTWWYGDADFLTDRWHFVMPAFMHTPTAALLMTEALEIARIAGLKFLHNGKIRAGKDGVLRLMPKIYTPQSDNESQEA